MGQGGLSLTLRIHLIEGRKGHSCEKVLIMIGNIALYLGVFYALLYLLRSTYNYEVTLSFAKFLDRNPAMFMAVLFTLITLVYLLIFRIKGWIWPHAEKICFARRALNG